jgi:hypothetical protein
MKGVFILKKVPKTGVVSNLYIVAVLSAGVLKWGIYEVQDRNESSAMERHGKHMGSYKYQAQPPS